ncbi:hypothetical protein DFR24_2425 [Panacagrimonas perspica]|uniref:Uncharacterized protein n=1 Tax=Panacagrimonas perspica TaxID=381431 RepID=A0A4V3F5A1_9GAMM|nr:hypothetical protein DFR24_2425 [Panacagrimonas perspica]
MHDAAKWRSAASELSRPRPHGHQWGSSVLLDRSIDARVGRAEASRIFLVRNSYRALLRDIPIQPMGSFVPGFHANPPSTITRS